MMKQRVLSTVRTTNSQKQGTRLEKQQHPFHQMSKEILTGLFKLNIATPAKVKLRS